MDVPKGRASDGLGGTRPVTAESFDLSGWSKQTSRSKDLQGGTQTVPDGGNFIGVGLYTVPEAARLTRVSPSRIRRWVFGRGGAAALERQLPPVEGQDALGFYNLVEALFIRDLSTQGVSWPTIRKAAERARDVIGDAHPFAAGRLHTDGRSVFLEVAQETGDRQLLNLVDGNFAMLDVLERSFTRTVTFAGPEGRASEWRPEPDLDVVLDPQRRFGRPIINGTGVPTDVLASALVAEKGNLERVARWWQVPAEAVRQAAEFEVRYGLRRAA